MATRATSRVTVQRAVGIAALIMAAGATVLLFAMPTRQPPAEPSVAGKAQTTSTATVPAATRSSATPPQVPVTSTTTSAAPIESGPATTSPAPSPSARATGGIELPATALVVGDGFTAATVESGAADQSFACQAVRARGWGCINESSAGSGYLSSGSAGAFAQQLTGAVTPTQVGLIVITGGVADRLASPSSVETAVSATLGDARKAYPSARIVVLRPFATQRTTTTLRAVALTLGRLAQGPGVDYVDTLRWFDSVSPVTTSDGSSLTPAAVSVAASELYDVLPPAPSQ